MKRRGHELLIRRVRQQVPRELFGGELVERFVGVKRPDEIIPISPDRAQRIVRISGRVRIARLIEPEARPMFAESRLRQQAVDHAFISTRSGILLETLHIGRSRGQAGQIQRHPARNRGALGLRCRRKFLAFQSAENEAVHRIRSPSHIAHLRECRSLRRDVSPVRCIRRTLLDPFFDQLFLPRREFLVGFRRRHHLRLVGRHDSHQQFAFVRPPRDDGRKPIHDRERAFPRVQPQPALAPFATFAIVGIRSVTTNAVLRKDRPNVPVEIDRFGHRCRGAKHSGNPTHRTQTCRQNE